MPQSNIKIFLPTQKKPCAYFQSPSNLDLDPLTYLVFLRLKYTFAF